MKSLIDMIVEGKRGKNKNLDIPEEERNECMSVLDKMMNDLNTEQTDKSSFNSIIKKNGPCIYAFVLDKLPNAIKIGYTDQHPLRRIEQWQKKYNDVGKITCIGWWSSEEFNTIGKRVFFWDHAVHDKVVKRGYHNIKEDEFRNSLLDKDNMPETVYYSTEFFSKFKDVIKGKTNIEENVELSEELLEAIISEMRDNIKNKDLLDFPVYEFDDKGRTTTKEADRNWGVPDGYSNTDLQNDCITEGVAAMKDKKIKNMLMAAVMRFGKTHATYEIIKNSVCPNGQPVKNVIVTSGKADVRDSWRNDINHKNFYKDFVFIEIINKLRWDVTAYNEEVKRLVTKHVDIIDGEATDIKYKNDLPTPEEVLKQYEDKTRIFFFTLQDLSGSRNDNTGTKDKHKPLVNIHFDLMVVDETHYGSHSNKWGEIPGLKARLIGDDDEGYEASAEVKDAQEAINKIKKLNIKFDKVLQVSGTPYYILASNETIKKDFKSICTVSYSDMLNAKRKWEDENPDADPSTSPYFGIPTLHKVGLTITKQCRDVLKGCDMTTSFNTLFETKHGKFIYEDAIKELIISIFGAKSEQNSDTLALLTNKKVEGSKICKHTIMVLPSKAAVDAMKNLLEDVIDTDKRTVFSITGLTTTNVKNIDDLNNRLEELDNNDKKSIMLTVRRFMTGVSIPLADSMLYLRNTSSVQDYDQTIFRLCTRHIKKVKNPDTKNKMPKKINMKENVYLIDFNIDNMFAMINRSARMKAIAMKDPRAETVKEYMKQEILATPIYAEGGINGEIFGKMEEISHNDLLRKYFKYDSKRSIDDRVDEEADMFKNLFYDENFQGLVDRFAVSTRTSSTPLSYYDDDSNFKNLDKLKTPEDPVKDKHKLRNLTDKINDDKKAAKIAADETQKKFANITKYLLYFNICLDRPCIDMETLFERTKKESELRKRLYHFHIDINDLHDLYEAMDTNHRMAYNDFLSDIVCRVTDNLSDYETFTNAMKGFSKIERDEIITPPNVVNKMLDKLTEDDFKKAKSILLVNEKQAEFFMGIYNNFGKSIVKKCKIIPSSMIGKYLTEKMLKTIGIDDYINHIIDIEDKNKNGKISCKDDFLNMTNEELLSLNSGKKFDIVLMNPPYDKNLHLKFMEKTFEVITENGALVYIGPDKWIINKYGFAEKSILRKNARDKYAKYIDSIETFDAEQFNKYFGTSNTFGVSIFKMKHNAKGLNLEDYQSKDELLNGIIEKITNKFSSLRSHFVRKTDDKLFVSIRRTNHGYLNWVERDGKNNAKDGILFDTENEKNNFISSFDTWLYQYLNCTDWRGAENSADVPYLNDYTSKWTNDKLFKLFEIDKENQKYILNLIKDKNPWKL